MKSIVYSPWDGTQLPFSVRRKEIVDRFMENILKGMSPNMSIAEMLWHGFPLAGMDFRVMGLEEMLEELQKQKKELYSKYNLERIFDEPIDALKHLLAEEAMTRMQMGAERPPSFEELPPGLLEKLKALQEFPFMSQDSRGLLDHWLQRQNDIQELFEFYSQYSSKFTGDQSLDFDEALELMRHLKSLENLQVKLLTGDITSIDPRTLQQMLGEEAEQSLRILLELPQMMADEGIVKPVRRGLDMTPRGMRSLAEMAFGKVYRQLKRDRQGGHMGNAPQSGEIEPDSSRPYEFGDRFDLDITKTLLKAVSRRPPASGRLELSPEDLYVREREPLIASTTVLLLDLSWSMSWEGRFEAGKKVALALDHYVRTRFPKDTFHVVGFSTVARELRGRELALAVWD
ncbi:hypothetical protein ACFL0Q_06230, partial [Thermodesulfobacteriota bacterium]